MDKTPSKYEQSFNKAVDIYIKKYQLNIHSFIKFIDEKIDISPETKNVVVSEIMSSKPREETFTKEILKGYFHMVAAAQANIDIRGKKIQSFSQYYRLTYKKSKKEESKVSTETKPQKKEEKVQDKKKNEEKHQVQAKIEIPPSNNKSSSTESSKSNQSNNDINKQAPKRSSKQSPTSPKKQLQVIEEDVVDQNRVSNMSYRTEQVSLKLPAAQTMNLKQYKSVRITGFDKFGQNYLNPIIKFYVAYGERPAVCRRYSEFQRLMNYIGRRYEGFILPELPPKEGIKSNLSYFRGVDQAFLNDRQQKLQEMLNCLVNSKFINKDEVLEKFLTDQHYQIESNDQGGIFSYLRPLTSIALNTKQLKNYGIAYYNYLKEFNKSEINTVVTTKYKEVEPLLALCLTIDNYRNTINTNFERRRDIFKQLKMDRDDRNLIITKFDKLSSSSASQIKNLNKEINKYIELKSQESWLSFLIREKEAEPQGEVEELRKNKEQIVSRVGAMENNLIISIDELTKEKTEYLQTVGDRMIEWRKSIHP